MKSWDADLAGRVEAGAVSPESADILRRYLNEQAALMAMRPVTLRGMYHGIIIWGLRLENLTTAAILKKKAEMDRKGLMKNTMHGYLISLKRFLKWAREEGLAAGVDPKKIAGIKTPPIDASRLEPEDMLKPADIAELVETEPRSRNRAILALLFDSGLRPAEAVALTWKDVNFDEYGCTVRTNGKTGKERYIRLTASAGHMAAWRRDYPTMITDDAPVFVASYSPYEPVTYNSIRKIFKAAIARVPRLGDKHLYIMRHSFVTDLIERGIPESAIKKMAWGNLKTPMIERYGHVGEDYVDREVLDRAGIKRGERKPRDASFDAAQCDRCGEVNPPRAEHCMRCGRPLTERAAMAQDNLHAMIGDLPRTDPELLRQAIVEEVRRALEAQSTSSKNSKNVTP